MKFIYSLAIAVLFFTCTAKAQYVPIPDYNFRAFLMSRYPACFDGDLLNISCSEITTEDSLIFHDLGQHWANMTDIEGIQYFSSLKYLDCSNNFIVRSPAMPASLKYLDMSGNGGSPGDGFVPGLPNTLTYLNCSNNYIGYLPFPLPDSLHYLNCSGNSLYNLPALPQALTKLICGGQLSYGPFTHILSSLPNLPPSLVYLDCSTNGLTSLPTLPAGLKYLDCSYNDIHTNPETIIKTLSNLPELPDSLTTLICTGNIINSMPALSKALSVLKCSDNKIYCLPRLPLSLTTLEYDGDKITCLPNSTSAAPTAAICSITNNVNNCSSFPVISGTVFSDMNLNGIKDNNEQYLRYIKVLLSNGAYTFAGNNGAYALGTDSLGNYSVAVNTPYYYNAVPAQASFNFTSYSALVTANFALQPTITKDSVQISITPINAAARPGAGYPYWVSYTNAGTTTLPVNIQVGYDSLLLTYDSSSNAALINNGSTLSYTTNELVPGEQQSFISYFRVKTTAVIGNVIKTKANAIANTSTATDSSQISVRGSYDPNEKEGTPSLTLAEVLSEKKFINYTIHFQNTGNDTAFHILILDTLSSNLQPGTFQFISSSHPCKVSITNNIVSFECHNILLPDSNVNKLKSHGFVSFKILANTAIAANNYISNKAAIYFDYNAPVITNTTSTLIQAPSMSFTFNGNGNWNDATNWAGAQIPASTIPAGVVIFIDPAANGECILNVPVTVVKGAAISVQPGKKLKVTGNLTIQ